MKAFRAFLGAAALVSASVVAGPAAADAPAVSVTPSTGLAGGDTVQVAAAGVTPSASVDVVECDIYNGDQTRDCYPRTTTTADPNGNVSVGVLLVDPVWRNQEVGDPKPVYCRADICHIFLAWTDSSDVLQVLSSDALEFTGSPATIAAAPNTNLTRNRRVSVTGTAYGAEGRAVRILEKVCFNGASAGSGCEDGLPAVNTTVRSDGTFAVRYSARRFLPDGEDCANLGPISRCEINAVVLKADGSPDDSFGVSDIGQPAAVLTFRSR